MSMIEVKNISLRFDKPVLKNIGFRVKKGHIVGLVGKSGAGKSSLLNIISGHLAPNEGEVHLKGNKLQDPSSLLVPGYQQIKIVSQDYHLDPYHTIEENIREAVISLPESEKKHRVKALLSLLKLNDISHIKAIHASGGEQQRLSIARAIALQPDVLLLDEPFSNLDAELRARLFEYILKLRNEEHLTIIIVSHDGKDVLGLSDYIYFLNNGKLSPKKTPFNAYYNLKHLSQSKLFGVVNQISIKQKKIRFRPDEYNVSGPVDVCFEHSLFFGNYYLNYFKSKNEEQVILSSATPLEYVKNISIVRKHPVQKTK